MMLGRLAIFLILNFAALGIGGLFTGSGVASAWYAGLDKAPWTPPGWVFGAAWTTIMLCFSLYMAYLLPQAESKTLLWGLYALQWLLNVAWNPLFFHFRKPAWALTVILLLTLLIGFFLWNYRQSLGLKSLLLLPYFLWLLIATSLNAFIVLKN
ncbi:MAG: tryptophan-rich sensory protein [Thermonema sp.]|uniref:TspO/MBR family protein n=1 Tax=Thermonema sp. TaxID=2231181 RepID=UPI0021DDDF6B|nr:TspO/MBR family protein [Thermonema sp.]GIV40495.1 MAG: tryptophan-rich sensory protein [Thermonema sp.]